MKQNTTQGLETKMDKLLSNFLLGGIALIIISLPLVNIYSWSNSNGDSKYLQEWIGGPVAAIGIIILSSLFATKKVVYNTDHPEKDYDIITRKAILWGLIYAILFVMLVVLLSALANMIIFFLGSHDYSQSTVTFSSLSGYSLLASIFLSLAFSPMLATWVAKKKVQFRDEDYKQKLAVAHNYEYAMNYDAAIAIYEELGLWDDARRCREKKMPPVQK